MGCEQTSIMFSNREHILGGQDRDLPDGTAEQAAKNPVLYQGTTLVGP
jgi:hypothetical protein